MQFILVDVFDLCIIVNLHTNLGYVLIVPTTMLWYNSMADSNMENIPEDEHMDVDEGLEGNDESALSKRRNVPFLTALNIVLLVSYLSLSKDECLSLEDTEKIETATTQESV